MIAFSDTEINVFGLIIVAVISAGGSIFVAKIAHGGRKAAQNVEQQIATENDYPIGQGIHNLEGAASRVESRVGRLDVKLDRLERDFLEHLAETIPVTRWVVKKMQEESERRDRRRDDVTDPPEERRDR